jgi:flagellar hook-associated protein 2
MSVGGIGGGSDFIQQMLYLEAEPLRRLQSRRSNLDVRFGVMSDLRSQVGSLKSILAELAQVGSTSALRRFDVSSSHETLAVATASSTADVGSHSLNVSQLATAHALQSSELTGTGGDIASGSYSFDVTVAGTTTNVSVTIDDTDDNASAMDKIAQAIRSTGVEVYANVVTTDTTAGTKRLVLTARETGEANMVNAIADTSGGLMASLGLAGSYNPGEVAGATTIAARNAEFTLDGVQISSATNDVEGVLEGVVISLKDDSAPGTTVNLRVDYDRDAVKEKIQELIDTFNEVSTFLNQKLASGDETGAGRGELAGDLTFTTFRNQLRQSLVRAVGPTFAQDGINTIDDVGFSLSRDGKLSLEDEEAFFNALTSSPDGVEAFLGSEDGVATRLEDIVKAFTKVGGGLDLEEDLIDSRRDVLDLRIERMESFLSVREEQLRDELGRLSQFIARIGAQQNALGSLFSTSNIGFGF